MSLHRNIIFEAPLQSPKKPPALSPHCTVPSGALGLKTLQNIDDIDAYFVDVIATLHNEEGGNIERADHLAGSQKIGRGQFEETDRIVLKGIHAQRDNQVLG